MDVNDLVKEVLEEHIESIVDNNVDVGDLTTDAVNSEVESRVEDLMEETLKESIGDWLYENLEVDDELIKDSIEAKLIKLVSASVKGLNDRVSDLEIEVTNKNHELSNLEMRHEKLYNRVHAHLTKRTWLQWFWQNL